MIRKLLAASILVAGIGAFAMPAQAQVTPVSELSDVQPTDWYFTSLQSLSERYGCIAGYPDGTYRGGRSLSRAEFAAGLNSCLDRMNELVSAGLADKVSTEDLQTVQRLQSEFAAELAVITGRTDALEAQTADLYSNPLGLDAFTSKLSFEVETGVFGIAGSDSTDNAFVPYRVTATLDSSFTGDDLFRVQLRASEGEDFDGDPIGLNILNNGSTDATVELGEVFYNFPMFDGRVRATLALNEVVPGDTFVFQVPYDTLSNFGAPESIYQGTSDGDVTIAATLEVIEDKLFLTYGYGSTEASGNDFGEGLFAGESIHAVELNYQPIETVEVAISAASAAGGQSGVSNDYWAAAAAINWEMHPRVDLSAYFAYTSTEGDEEFYDWQVGTHVRDIVVEGSTLSVLAGSPDFLYALNTDINADMPIQGEIAYTMPLTDNVSITPGVYYITNTGGDDVLIGGVRTTFTF